MRNTELGLEHLLEFAALDAFLENVETADELSVDNDLGESGPLVELLETLSYVFVPENVVVAKLDLLLPQEVDCLLAESATRSFWVPLHKEHHLALLHELLASCKDLVFGLGVDILLVLLVCVGGSSVSCGAGSIVHVRGGSRSSRGLGYAAGTVGAGRSKVGGDSGGECGCVGATDARKESVAS